MFKLLNKPLKIFNIILIVAAIISLVLVMLKQQMFSNTIAWIAGIIFLIDGIYLTQKKYYQWGLALIIGAVIIILAILLL